MSFGGQVPCRRQRRARVALDHMERIDITSGRPPSVDRPEGSKTLFLTFDGLRNAKVRDRDTRIRIALQGPQAVRLWRLLGGALAGPKLATLSQITQESLRLAGYRLSVISQARFP